MATHFSYAKGRHWPCSDGKDRFYARYTAVSFDQATVNIPFPEDGWFQEKILDIEHVNMRVAGDAGGVNYTPRFYGTLDNTVPFHGRTRMTAWADQGLCWKGPFYVEVPKSGNIGDVTAVGAYAATDSLYLVLQGILLDYTEAKT